MVFFCNIGRLKIEGTELVFQLVFKTSSRRIKPAVAGSIPALSANFLNDNDRSKK